MTDAARPADHLRPSPDGNTLCNRLYEPLERVFGRVPAAWRSVTDPFIGGSRGKALAAFVDERVRSGAVVYPAQVLRALDYSAPQGVRAVILGQDPYHGPGQAQGLAFSVQRGHKSIPPSLRNILAEVRTDTGADSACGGDLSAWAEQGVLLLNSTLTVEDGLAHGHAGRGWEEFTDQLLGRVAAQRGPVAFMLWGVAAQRKRPLLEQPGAGAHLVLCANHPSPLSARRGPVPFIGCRHFTQANAFFSRTRPDLPSICW